jgi:hypothetical protein
VNIRDFSISSSPVQRKSAYSTTPAVMIGSTENEIFSAMTEEVHYNFDTKFKRWKFVSIAFCYYTTVA